MWEWKPLRLLQVFHYDEEEEYMTISQAMMHNLCVRDADNKSEQYSSVFFRLRTSKRNKVFKSF